MISKKHLVVFSCTISFVTCYIYWSVLQKLVKRNVIIQTQSIFSVPLSVESRSAPITAKIPLEVTRVIVSLTSFSWRLDHINETLQSIFEQTYQPHLIYLSIPFGNYSRYELPTMSLSEIVRLQETYKGTSLRVIESHDYGPATKLLGVLNDETAPDTIIITIDDDTVYHPQMLGYLVTTLSHLSADSSVAVVCETVSNLHQEWQWTVANVNNDYCKNGFLAAWAGAAYRRKYFDQSIFDYEDVPDGCVLHDDVYISGYLARKGIFPYIFTPTEPTGRHPWSVIQHQTKTNLTVNATPNVRGRQLACIQYFNYFR